MKKIITLCSALCLSTAITPVQSLNKNTKTVDIFFAVETNNYSLVKKLVKTSHVSLNQRNDENKTILDIAVEKNYKKIARFLVKRGAGVTTQENAARLKNNLKKRAVGFFIGGFFCWPLWIGTATALSDKSDVMVV